MSDGPSNTSQAELPVDDVSAGSGSPSNHGADSAGPESLQEVTGIESNDGDSTNDLAYKKRDELLYELLRSLDILVYVELAAIYYLDISTPLLLLRSLLHLSQLTIPDLAAPSRHPTFLHYKPPLANPNTPLLLAATALCFFIHAFTAPPEASELTRFYLHGSLVVDFIGQHASEGWIARTRLCTMDIVFGVIQLVTCAVAAERSKIGSGRSSLGGHGETPIIDRVSAIPTAGIVSSDTPSIATAAAFVAAAARRGRGMAGMAGLALNAAGAAHTDDIAIELDALTYTGRRVDPPVVTSRHVQRGTEARNQLDEDSTSGTEHDRLIPGSSNEANQFEPPAVARLSTPLYHQQDIIEIPSAMAPIDTTGESLASRPRLGEQLNGPAPSLHLLEQLYAGQVIVADLNLFDMLRNHFWDQRNRRFRGSV